MTSANTFVDTLTKNPDYSNLPYLACCALIIQDNQIFISQRKASQSYAGLWEYPGGKIERNETLYEALVREVKEEVGLTVHKARPIMSICTPQHRWVSVWMVEEFTGTAWGKEQQYAQWACLEVLTGRSFLPSNKPILDYIHQARVLI